MTEEPSVPSEASRRDEVRAVCRSVAGWAAARPDVVAVGLAGSWARGAARAGSDVDLVVVADVPEGWIQRDDWIAEALGQDVTLVFTNQSGTAQTMPTIPLTASYLPTVAASAIQWDDGVNAVKRRIADFNRDGWAALAGPRGTAPSQASFGATPPLRPHRARPPGGRFR